MKWRIIQVALLLFIAINWGNAGYIALKAELAQWLIKQAWAETLASGEKAYPWPWADNWPVARLLTDSGEDLYVLAGAHGTSLAFGPGHVDGTATPGNGHAVIGGHRDTHFSFMRTSSVGDTLQLQTVDGRWHSYTISEREIVDIHQQPLLLQPDFDQLQLITCYPFNELLPNGPLRLSVMAVKRVQ